MRKTRELQQALSDPLSSALSSLSNDPNAFSLRDQEGQRPLSKPLSTIITQSDSDSNEGLSSVIMHSHCTTGPVITPSASFSLSPSEREKAGARDHARVNTTGQKPSPKLSAADVILCGKMIYHLDRMEAAGMDVTTAKGLVIEACQGDHWPSDVLDELLRVAAIAQELSGQTLGKVGQEVFRGF